MIKVLSFLMTEIEKAGFYCHSRGGGNPGYCNTISNISLSHYKKTFQG